MKRLYNLLLLSLIFSITAFAQQSGLKDKLSALPGVTSVEQLESSVYPEKYVIKITQQVDPKTPAAGTFQQRVVIGHVGYDRPTVMVTEGYGGAYALSPRYQEELTKLFNANLVFVEHRYFLESTPNPCNWDYLTAENATYDLHHVNQTMKQLYKGKWISTGISKGGQTTMQYRTYFPDDVDFSVPYVGPLCRGVEDGRHEPFLEKKVGTKAERKAIKDFQIEVLKRKAEIIPMLDSLAKAQKLTYRIPIAEVLDYCVLEYPFALWQWGTPISTIPSLKSDTKTLFDYLFKISEPNYFANDQPLISFFVQAARELGYYGYDTKPLKKYLTIKTAHGYLNRLMLPADLVNKVEFRPALYHKIYNFLKDNDPKMIFIYGGIDPWGSVRVPAFKGKVNEQIYVKPRGSHATRITDMPEPMHSKIMNQINTWLAE